MCKCVICTKKIHTLLRTHILIKKQKTNRIPAPTNSCKLLQAVEKCASCKTFNNTTADDLPHNANGLPRSTITKSALGPNKMTRSLTRDAVVILAAHNAVRLARTGGR